MTLVAEAPFSELSHYTLDRAALRALPLSFCQRQQVAVLGEVPEAGPVTVGMLHPEDPAAVERVAHMLRRVVAPVRLTRYELHRALESGWGGFPEDALVLDLDAPRMDSPDATAAELLEQLLKDAILARASDIHIEAYRDDVDVRLRRDGILHQTFTHITPLNIHEVLGRIKVLARLDITERRRPQDGRIGALLCRGDALDRSVDFRISIAPAPAGEDAVIRVLDAQHGLLRVEELGMDPGVHARFQRLIHNPEGLLLVTGPTGSGKTTTLYAALRDLNNGTSKIVTAEDPIEYTLGKINQKQVSELVSMGDLLRALLRQDPDVMMFGEIRDVETAEVALRAAATGHLVLGTLHTHDALGAVVRLRGLELDDGEIGANLLGVIGQRLVRRLCVDCRAEAEPTAAQRASFGDLLGDGRCWRAVGCSSCEKRGYRGRLGLYELLVVDDRLQALITAGATRPVLQDELRRTGFRTLLEDGLARVARGDTSLEELERVIPWRQIASRRSFLEGWEAPRGDLSGGRPG